MTDDGKARALLDALMHASTPPEDRVERALARVEARIVASEQTPVATLRAEVYRTEWLRPVAIAVAIAAMTLLAMRAVIVGVGALRAGPERAAAAGDVVDPPPREQVQSRDETTAQIVVPAPATDTTADRIVPALPESPSLSVPRHARAADAPASAPPAAGETARGVEAELALVRAARAETDAHAALALLDRHADRFPHGVLAPEREMLRAERLCTLGRRDAARVVATRFVAENADHPLTRRMRKVCTAP